MHKKIKAGIYWIRKGWAFLQYAGWGVQCPVCRGSFRVFAPYGEPLRKNALCPSCGSLERHRMLHLFLQREKSLSFGRRPSRVLHFAPAECLYQWIAGHPSIDYHPCDLDVSGFRWKLYEQDITAMTFPDRTFDVVLANHVLEHVGNDRAAMQELYRVLQWGGWGIFQVPINEHLEHTYEDSSIVSPADRQKAFGQWDHVRWYGRDYPDRLREAGFRVKVNAFWKTFSPEEKFRYGLLDEDIFVCYKTKATSEGPNECS